MNKSVNMAKVVALRLSEVEYKKIAAIAKAEDRPMHDVGLLSDEDG